MGRYRWVFVGAVAVLCSCVALSRLFEEKPKIVAGGSGGSGSGSGSGTALPDGSHGLGSNTPRVPLGPIFDRYPFPKGTPIGSWVTLRITRPGEPAVEETWAAIGADGDAVWVEHTDSPQGRGLLQVTCYLVAPDGLLRLAVRGRPGADQGSLLPSSTAASNPGFHESLLGGTPTGRRETIVVAAGSYACEVVDLDGGEGTAWVADTVPFHGLVRVFYGAQPQDRITIELIATGTDRTKTQLAGELPRWVAASGGSGSGS